VYAYLEESALAYQVQSELNRNILDVFNENSVQIMTPSFESNPAEPVLVPKDQWNAEPAQGSNSRPRPSGTAKSRFD
jgi:hypothetical protein